MTDAPVYITALRIRSDFVPVMMSVVRDKDCWRIGWSHINGLLSMARIYRPTAEQAFDSEEEAQSALNKLALKQHWKPYQKLRRF